jgi:hypothetical protein
LKSPKSFWEFPKSFWEFPKSFWEFPKSFWEFPKSFWEFPKSFWEFPKSFWKLPFLVYFDKCVLFFTTENTKFTERGRKERGNCGRAEKAEIF